MSFKLRTNHITIETTNACPSNCIMCPQDKYVMKRETMTMELWKKIIDDLATHGYKDKVIIDTQGLGDPFADPLLFDRIRYAKKKIPCARTFTSSTCYLMTPDKYKDVIECIDTLKISSYGMTKETFEKIHRGSITFEQCMFNIDKFIWMTKDLEKRPYIVAYYVLFKGINDHEKDDWLEFWEPRVDEVMIWLPHNYGGLRDYRTIDHSKQASCGRPVNGPMYVHCDGVVSVCCWDINERLVIGDLKKDTIEDCYHSENYRRIRDLHAKKDFKDLYCYNCEQTNPSEENFLYQTNPKRKFNQMTSDFLNFKKGTSEA